MRETVGKSRNTVFFQWFEAPEGRKVGSLKRRVRSQLARWEMKKIARRCGAKHISRSKCTKHTRFGPLLEVAMSKKCTPLWREATFRSQNVQSTPGVTTFGSCDVEKVHAVVARSTCRSQNVEGTACSDHFLTFRCRFAWQAQGIVHLVRNEQNVGFVVFPKTMAGVGHLKRVCKDAFSVAGAVQETSSSELLGGQGADFLRGVAFWSIKSSGLLRWFCVTGAALRMTWHHFFVAGAVPLTGGVEIKRPDNPTRQLLPIRKGKGGGGGTRSKTKLCVTKLYVKDGVWQRQMVSDKVVCDKVVWKMVCQRWWVTKLCVKDGVWQSGVWKMVWRKMVCDKVACERWCGERRCATKLCVKDGVWQSGVWSVSRMVCERWRVTKLCVKDSVWQSWKMVRDKVWKMVCVWQRWCVKEGVSKMVCDKAPCVKDGGWQSCVWKMVWQRWWVTMWCVKDGVSKMVCDKVGCERGCVKDVVWRRWCVKESCKRVYQRWCVKDGVRQSVWKMVCDKDGVWHHSQPNAIRATPATQNEGGCLQVPRLPCETKVDVTKCHACHAKCRGVTRDQAGPSAPPSAMSATPATQNDRGCEIVPRLPCETKVDVTKCHACHAKCRGVTRDQAGPSAPPSAMSATPATQNDRGCEIAPRLPRETKVDVTKCHACHAGCRASGATKRAQARHPVPWVPRLPRKTTVDVRLCHVCHVKLRWMSPSATPATQSAAASRATKRAQARHPVPWVPRLPRKTTVDVRLFHACHVKLRWMSPSATLATQSAAASHATKRAQARHPVPWVPRLPRETKVDVRLRHAYHAKWRWMSPSATGVWKMVCQKVVCERWYVTKMGVKDGAWWCVTKLYVQDGMWQRWYVTDGVWKMVCQKVWQRWCVTGGRREGGDPGYRIKKKQNVLVRGRQLCIQLSIFEGNLAELFRFCCQFWKMRKSRRIVSFLMSSSAKKNKSMDGWIDRWIEVAR